MMTLIEELRLAVLELWQALGLERSSRTAAAVVPALVVGIVLNLVALNVAGVIRVNANCAGDGVHDIVQSQVNDMQGLLASTRKQIDKGERGLCRARQWIEQQQVGTEHPRNQASCAQAGHKNASGV